jgi:HEAT repeat protein
MSAEIASLLKDLAHADPCVKEAALDRIGELRPAHAFDLLAAALTDADAEVRASAACNLAQIPDSRVVPLLIRLVDTDSSEQVQAEALASLGEYHHPHILACLLRQVYGPRRPRRMRQEVAKQLGRYGTEEALQALQVLRKDDDAFVRDYAAESLAQLDGRPAPPKSSTGMS